jgi:hypothetical protein
LPHGLNRSGGVSEPDGPASVDGSAHGGGVANVGEVGEAGGDGSVRDAIGPWGRPLGPMVMRAVQRTTGVPTRPVTSVMWHLLASSSLPSSSPECPMTRALGPVQPGWGKPIHRWHTVPPSDPMERHQGPRPPSASKLIVQGKGTGPLQHAAVWRGRR